jgi:hypothetical protein
LGAIDDLAAIAQPEGRPLTIGGRTIRVTPVMVRSIAPIARRIKPFGEGMFRAMSGAGIGTEELLEILADHGDGFIEAVALASQQDAGWVGDLQPHELLRLAVAIVEENQDFFVRWLLPSVTAMAMSMTRAAGGTRQQDSPPQDTATG